MDLLFKRYASPLKLLDGMLSGGMLCRFVDEIVKKHNEETEEKTRWEFYLHRVFDMSFEEFTKQNKTAKAEPEAAVYDEQYVETTLQNSRNILKRFNLK